MDSRKFSSNIFYPDHDKLSRFKRRPELGPRILFFSGGTALRDLSAKITEYTHNSIHIITPFDSGGSSAKLRAAFHIPAVGDVRNRLMALADRSLHGNPEVFALFFHRFPSDADNDLLEKELDGMVDGTHPLSAAVPNPMNRLVRRHLEVFRNRKPSGFDLRGASVGNLVITGGWLDSGGNLESVIHSFSSMIKARGVVRTVTEDDLHLAAELESGDIVAGQHLITSRETSRQASKIKRIFLVPSMERPRPYDSEISESAAGLVSRAEIICFPIGSFFTSVIANILPRGVGNAVASSGALKVFIPNTGNDIECRGMDVMEQVETLILYLTKDNPSAITPEKVLNVVLIDGKRGGYNGHFVESQLLRLGIRLISAPLITSESSPLIAPVPLIETLLSLV